MSTAAEFAKAGFAAALLLTLIEAADLNVRLGPVFENFTERLTLAAYFSINLFWGLVIGFVTGLAAALAGLAISKLDGRASRSSAPPRWRTTLATVGVAAAGAALLDLVPEVHRYVLGCIREAEKIALARVLLRAENFFTYLTILAILLCCGLLGLITRKRRSGSTPAAIGWMILLASVILAAYYVDSRVEVQQYEFSLHRSMFLLGFALALSLVSSAGALFRPGTRTSTRCATRFNAAPLILVTVIAGVAFTIVHFDRNQNLKTQVFFRTVETKQFVKLMQWALDFDRDGYSSLLGGGDSDDRRSTINPGQPEIADDGVDNNCIGGDISSEEVDSWMHGFQQLNTAPNPDAKRFNVLYVFIDTVRADHLTVYGYGRKTTPALEKLAQRSFVFDNAFTPAPSTYQAVPKFMQSSYWDAHVETWTETLARNGYDTILFPARRAATLYRRIKDPHLIGSTRTSNMKESVDALIQTFQQRTAARPLCAYLYTFEPHAPYKPRRDFNFGSKRADLYDGEIAYCDHQLGRLIDWLDENGRLKDTMIVIMSDHGESLGERDVYKHNAQLYNEQMHVPMIVYVPGMAGRRIRDYVSTIDLGSTILNTVGVSCPMEYVGASLVPLMRNQPFTLPPVYGEHWQRNDSPFWGPERNVDPEIKKYMIISQDGFKLITSLNYNTFELFNLGEDPLELHNLYDRMPEKAAELKMLLGRYIDVVSISRPADADEQRFFKGHSDEDSGEK